MGAVKACGCQGSGVWVQLGGQHISWHIIEGIIKVFACLSLTAYMKVSAWRARKGHWNAARDLIFPIYRVIIYGTLLIDSVTALVQTALNPSTPEPAIMALSWALSRFITEGLTAFLLQSGVGVRTIRCSVMWATGWAILSFVARYMVYYLQPRDAVAAHILGLAYYSPPSLFYVVLALSPMSLVPRRPSLRPVALMMILVFLTMLTRELLQLQGVFLPSACVAWSVLAMVVWLIFPWTIYRALVLDSRYWQGMYVNPRAGNLNTPLMGVWGALPFTPASALASLVCDLEEGVVPVIPFGQIRLRTDKKYFSGSNSRVYVGEYKGETVAVKMLFSMELDIEVIRDFCEEARVLHSLAHPHILMCHGACIMPPAICLVTEFCENGSLFCFLKKHRDQPELLPWQVRVRMMLHCVSGLEHMHSRGLVHSDIKSLNFLVTGDVMVKLGDLGECRREGQQAENGGPVHPTTAYWSAPEVLSLQALSYSCAMDIYSLGLVLNEIMTLDVPFSHEPFTTMEYAEFVNHVCRCGSRPPMSHQTPLRLKELLMACWHRDPLRRPAAAEVLEELEVIYLTTEVAGMAGGGGVMYSGISRSVEEVGWRGRGMVREVSREDDNEDVKEEQPMLTPDPPPSAAQGPVLSGEGQGAEEGHTE